MTQNTLQFNKLDFPAHRATLGSDAEGNLFLAAIQIGPTEHRLAVTTLAEPGGRFRAKRQPDVLDVSSAGILDVRLCQDEQGRMLALWNRLGPEGAKLYFATCKQDGRWGKPIPVAAPFGSCLSPALARDSNGQIWCAFQANTTGAHHIFATWYHEGQWAFPQRISEGDGHCFAPAICPFDNGVRVVWDARIQKKYGVYMRELDSSFAVKDREPQATLTLSDALLANPAIVDLDGGSSLVVYERAQEHWGTRNKVERPAAGPNPGHYLGSRRDLQGMLLSPKGGAALREPLPEALEDSSADGPTSRLGPRLFRHSDGTICLAFRQWAGVAEGQEKQNAFVQALTFFVEGSWTKPLILPQSHGTSALPCEITLDAAGRLLALYLQRKGARYFAHLARGPKPIAKICRCDRNFPAAGKWRPLRVTNEGRPHRRRMVMLNDDVMGPRLLWGDLHRHSEMSACWGSADGSPLDAYRYAMQAMDLDFFALTDHAWYLSKPDTKAEDHNLANAFYLPGRFTAFCAYEANFPPGEGHIVVLGEGSHLPVTLAKHRAALLRRLDSREVVAVPHHPGDPGQSYRWQGHDETLAPVAEIWQPYRTAFESAAAPAPFTPWRTRHEIVDECTLLAAWKMGLKLGVLASSDHLSTGGAFAGVWAQANTRSEILAAIRRRHCFAASARIELAFWADEHFMGDVFSIARAARPKVQFRIRCRGENALDRIELLQDGEVLETFRPARRSARHMAARKRVPVPPGEHFYYLRVFQQDGNMAWSSPIWISKQPARCASK